MVTLPSDPTTPNLSELIERVERAEGPDREIDKQIWFALFCVPNEGQINKILGGPFDAARYRYLTKDDFLPSDGTLSPAYTSSLDAIVGLIERELPGWLGDVDVCTSWADDGSFGARLFPPKVDTNYASQATTPALAMCGAFLRALSARGGK
jgi:hypothetical protein